MDAMGLGTIYESAGGRISCVVCGKELRSRDVKVVLPSAALSAIPRPTRERLACSVCYKGLLARARRLRVRSMYISNGAYRINKGRYARRAPQISSRIS